MEQDEYTSKSIYVDYGVPSNCGTSDLNDQVWLGSDRGGTGRITDNGSYWSCFYKADITLLASESAKGVWNALIILIIVWTAILMYQVGDEAKAFLVIRNGMRKLLPNELLLVLAMG